MKACFFKCRLRENLARQIVENKRLNAAAEGSHQVMFDVQRQIEEKEIEIARAEVERMQALAVAMRKLIRVKIADDADLDQARSAVDVLLGFFENLATASAARGVSEFEMLRALD